MLSFLDSKQSFASKVFMEHDVLGITNEPELQSVDKNICSSLESVTTALTNVRLSFESGYFFFVGGLSFSGQFAESEDIFMDIDQITCDETTRKTVQHLKLMV